ncbi:exopolyphosphatase [Propionigenium maris DSM 9537]|uniref:Exopolyphosphatase n=1 Tax=Propionigenium maris DSM 9537 TaxID=1123000 RepID=A0A9W6GM99_9FUSO|nr:Ppx/GppA phosphatase family protein [Propionigenium maris]GLI56316.1 exopolyphosphatase [Propionigenium maris DSM 9537]
MKRIGIIDIGSNSIRLVIYEISPNRSFKAIEDIKESPRLGDGVNERGEMKLKRMDLAFHTLMLFKRVCERYGVDEIIPFATAAVRNSRNSHVLLDLVREQLGMDIKVFSGEDEAFFSFKGAINNLEVDEGILMDMGGASTELVWYKERKVHKWISLNFGSVTLSQIAQVRDSLSSKEEEQLKKYIMEEYSRVPWLKEAEGIPLIGVGGTIRNLAKVHSLMINYPLLLLHDYRMNLDEVESVYRKIKGMDYEEKLLLPGLARSRADIFTGAVCAIRELISYSSLSGAVISGFGIREGVLYEKLYEYGRTFENVFETSLFDTVERYSLSREDGERVYGVFTKILEALDPLHKMERIPEEILRTICYMGRVGVSVSFHDYPLHSFYMILNAELRGISHKDLVKAALIVSQQEKLNTLHKNYTKLLGKSDLKEITYLSIILRISKIFNRTFLMKREDFHVEIDGERVRFCIDTGELMDVQVSRMLMSGKRFKEVFGRQLEVVKK